MRCVLDIGILIHDWNYDEVSTHSFVIYYNQTIVLYYFALGGSGI